MFALAVGPGPDADSCSRTDMAIRFDPCRAEHERNRVDSHQRQCSFIRQVVFFSGGQHRLCAAALYARLEDE